MPGDEFLRELGHHEERAPRSDLLRLDYVAEDVVAHVQHVLAARSNQLREHVAIAARIHLIALQGARVAAEFLDARVLVDRKFLLCIC